MNWLLCQDNIELTIENCLTDRKAMSVARGDLVKLEGPKGGLRLVLALIIGLVPLVLMPIPALAQGSPIDLVLKLS